MKRLSAACFSLIIIACVPGVSAAFDMIGLQPATPNGVFSTFSTYSLPRQGTAIDVGAERSREPDFYRFSLRGAYGLTEGVELSFTLPYVYHFHDRNDGFEDMSVGIKHRFYDEGKYGPSLAYLITASVASGNSRFSTDGSYGLGFVMSKRIGPVMGHANLIFRKPGESRLRDEITLSGGIEFAAAHNFDLLGEILARRGFYSKNYDQVEARVGYRLRTTDAIYTTLGVGFDMKNRTPEYRILLLVGIVSPAEKKRVTRIYEEEQ